MSLLNYFRKTIGARRMVENNYVCIKKTSIFTLWRTKKEYLTVVGERYPFFGFVLYYVNVSYHNTIEEALVEVKTYVSEVKTKDI